MTDHYLLMTATPHKGDPENFCRFLSLLDRDVYGNIQSLQVARRTGTITVQQPTLFLDINPAPPGTAGLESETRPDRALAERFLYEQALIP
jgi:hypothetical protein